MNIEEGKFYRCRNGEVVGPLKRNEGGGLYKWIVGGQTYREDGFFSIEPSEYDLVEQVNVSRLGRPDILSLAISSAFVLFVVGASVGSRGQMARDAEMMAVASEPRSDECRITLSNSMGVFMSGPMCPHSTACSATLHEDSTSLYCALPYQRHLFN